MASIGGKNSTSRRKYTKTDSRQFLIFFFRTDQPLSSGTRRFFWSTAEKLNGRRQNWSLRLRSSVLTACVLRYKSRTRPKRWTRATRKEVGTNKPDTAAAGYFFFLYLSFVSWLVNCSRRPSNNRAWERNGVTAVDAPDKTKKFFHEKEKKSQNTIHKAVHTRTKRARERERELWTTPPTAIDWLDLVWLCAFYTGPELLLASAIYGSSRGACYSRAATTTSKTCVHIRASVNSFFFSFR